jgi:LysM repeat protein
VAGDWLYRIADNCGVTLEGIVAVNPGLNPDWIKAGNKLNLPAPANPPAGPPALPAVTDVSLPPDVGAAVSPSPLPQPLVASSSAALKTGCVGPHTVLAGENLFRIALNCGLTTEQMAAVNGIADPYVIYPGQVLVYP